MIVKCIANNISFLSREDIRERVREWVNSEGEYNDIEIGIEYVVQAIGYFRGGVFYYLHSVEVSEFPYPYVAEFFEVVDSSLPANWEVSFRVEDGKKRFKRLTFSEWANDDFFYEKLIDDDDQSIALYQNKKIE